MQVSRSKKWASKPLLDDAGKPIMQKNGKPVLKKSYSVLQDDFFNYMRNAGYTDVERGERGSTEEHLTVTQFKVRREQERLDTLTAQADQQKQSLAAIQKKSTLTKNALIHAQDVATLGKKDLAWQLFADRRRIFPTEKPSRPRFYGGRGKPSAQTAVVRCTTKFYQLANPLP